MDSNQEKTVAHIANGMLETLTMPQIMQICRDFAFLKAAEYYEGLEEKEKTDLVDKVTEAIKALQETQPS